MISTWMLRIQRALRKDPRYVARRVWQELMMAAERWRAPLRSRWFRLEPLWRKAGYCDLTSFWEALAKRPYPHARSMEAVALEALQPGCVEIVLARAELAHEHRIELLGSGPKQLPTDIDWLADFKTGRRWPLAFHRDINYNNFDGQHSLGASLCNQIHHSLRL